MDLKVDKAIIDRIKHIECFYEQAPPGYVKEEEERPEDCIPDTEENKAARDFLANAPSKGLWMPLGKEVKVMQCWRCKQYGHRTGDRECPMFKTGNSKIEKFRESYEDPMYQFVEKEKMEENAKKMNWLQQLVDVPTTSESSDDGGSPKKRKKSKGKTKEKWVEKTCSISKRKGKDEDSYSSSDDKKKKHLKKKNRKRKSDDGEEPSSKKKKKHKQKSKQK